MTDKIIIDGVDVSGCKLYDKTTHQLDFNKCGHVCKETECKYKRLWYKRQFQAEKEKVKELEERYKTASKVRDDNFMDAWALRKGLKEIKKIATINYINTCWTVIKNCEKCPDKNKCQEQNPLTKLKVIIQKCKVLENE